MSEKIKVGVIGCGTIANAQHLPMYSKSPNAEIAYVCDIIPERAKKAAEQYGGKAVTDYHEILKDESVKAVSVCTPNYCHSTISIDAIKAGKNVLCEKPAAYTLSEAEKMLEAKKETGKILNIGVCNRFDTQINKIKELIEEGVLGEIYNVYISFRSHRSIPGLGGAFTTKSMAGGGVLIDWGVHFLDIVMYCCGDPKAKTVSCETFSKLGRDIDDYTYVDMWAGPPISGGTNDVEEAVTGLIRTDGPVININGAWAQNIGKREMFIDFMGEKGGIRLNYGEDFTLYTVKNGMLAKTTFDMQKKSKFENEIEAFLEAVKSGKELASSISVNILTSRLMDAIYRSAETHKEIEL